MEETRTEAMENDRREHEHCHGAGSPQVHCHGEGEGPRRWFLHGVHVTKASSVQDAVGLCVSTASIAYGVYKVPSVPLSPLGESD